MGKYFILDTNVLIHNPMAIYSFADNNVIIPFVVIEELDRFKSHSDKKGMHARQVLREIDSLVKKGALDKGAKMKNGGTLKIDIGVKKELIPNVDPSLNDNKILGAAWHAKKKGEQVFFVSKDVNARIKAFALGIKAVDYEKQKVEYTNIYKGWKEVIVKKENIDAVYKEGELEIKGHSFYKNEYVLLKTEENESSSAICKYDHNKNKIVVMKHEYEAMGVHPINLEQKYAFDLLLDDKVKLVTLLGPAGTGKTLIAIACGLAKTIGGKEPAYEKLLVARPVIPLGKDIGYLPGSKNEKLSFWMQPISDNLDFIMRKVDITNGKLDSVGTTKDKVDYLIKSDILEIEALTYIRGRSIPKQYLIVDEAQNLTPHEVKTIISRAGDGTKIVLTGDAEQIDNPYLDANSNGLSYTIERLKDNELVGHVFLSKSERSDLASLAVGKL